MKGEGREQGIPWNDKIDKIDKIDTLPTCKGTMLDESKLVSNLSFESDYDRNAARSIETRCKISLFTLLNSPSIKKKREKIRNFAGKDRNGKRGFVRVSKTRRRGKHRSCQGNWTALDPVSRLYRHHLVARRNRALQIKASQRRPGNLCPFIHFDCFVTLCKSSPGTTPLELFIFLRGPFSRIHSTFFFSSSPLLFLLLASNRSPSFQIVIEENLSFVDQFFFPSSSLSSLSPLSCVEHFFLFSLLHGKISELRLDFTLMERDIGGIREKKINAKTLTITFRGRETFWKF